MSEENERTTNRALYIAARNEAFKEAYDAVWEVEAFNKAEAGLKTQILARLQMLKARENGDKAGFAE